MSSEPEKRRLAPNTVEGFKAFLFDLLEEPVGELGCAGPPECATCPGGVHDTGLGMFSGVIEVEISDTINVFLRNKEKLASSKA